MQTTRSPASITPSRRSFFAPATDAADAKDPGKGTVGDVVAAENKDRRALYEHLAKTTKVSAAEVGRQNGLRNLKNAKPDHWIEVQGKWVQRKSVKTVDDKDGTGDGK